MIKSVFKAIVIVCLFVSISSAELKDGLIGYWKFDEGKGDQVKDNSEKEHHGEVVEGKSEWVKGKEKTGFYFANTDIKVSDHKDFHLEQGISVALWAKPDGPQAEWAKFLCKQKTGEYPYSLQYDNAQSIFATVNASGRIDTEPKLTNFKEWAHLCFTYDGKAIILYKDGKEVARTEGKGKLQQNQEPISIGGRLNSGQDFKGSIDEVMLYNRGLTAEEVITISKGGNMFDIDPGSDKLSLTWSWIKYK